MKKRTSLIIISIIIVVLIFSSAGVIFLKNSSLKPATTTNATIDLSGTYDMNDLTIIEVEEKINDVDIAYPRIQGLKDTAVEEKINEELFNLSHALIEKYRDTLTYANFYTNANFANVLSISFQVGFDCEPYYDKVYFNYSLVDGSHLTLEDLFLPDTDLLDIVRSSFYSSLIYSGEYTDEEGTCIYSPNEDEVYVSVRNYMQKAEKPFLFSPTSIYLYADDNMANVPMIDYADLIVIYSKYVTDESIFTGEYTGFKNLITCSEISESMFEKIEYGYIEDNMWYDYTVTHDYIPSFGEGIDEETIELHNKLRDSVFASFYVNIDTYRQTARENPDKFYAVFTMPSSDMYFDQEYVDGTWHYDVSNLSSYTSSVTVYEMDKSIYEKDFRPLIAETYRYRYFAMRGGAYIYEDDIPEGVTCTRTTTSFLYDIKTGKLLTKLDEVFDPESNYLAFIENEVRDRLSYSDFTPEKIESLIAEMTVSLAGTSVEVDFPSEPDKKCTIYFGSFDKSMFKCFTRR